MLSGITVLARIKPHEVIRNNSFLPPSKKRFFELLRTFLEENEVDTDQYSDGIDGEDDCFNNDDYDDIGTDKDKQTRLIENILEDEFDGDLDEDKIKTENDNDQHNV